MSGTYTTPRLLVACVLVCLFYGCGANTSTPTKLPPPQYNSTIQVNRTNGMVTSIQILLPPANGQSSTCATDWIVLHNRAEIVELIAGLEMSISTLKHVQSEIVAPEEPLKTEPKKK